MRSTRLNLTVILTVSLGCSGCDPDGRAGGDESLGDGAARESGEVPAGAALPATLDPSAVPRLRLFEDLRLDAEAEDFSVVSRVLVGPAGQIVVPLAQDRQIWMYDAEGRRVAVVGRDGSGPGEFQHLGSAGWLADTLWINDARQNRITWVAPDGTVLRTRPTSSFRLLEEGDLPREVAFFGPSVTFADGSLLGEGRYWVPEESRVSEAQVLRVSADGDARILWTPPSLSDPKWSIEVDGLGWPMPFAQRPQSAVSADGSLFAYLVVELPSGADAGAVTLTAVRPAGDTVLARAYPFVGEPIPRNARDSAVAALAPDRPPTEGPPDLYQRRQAIARERMPAVFSPTPGFRIGLDGTFWIDLRESEEGRITLILNERGDPIGSVLVPGPSVIRQASRTHVWMTEPDPFGLASVVRYRVEGLPPG